MKITGLKVKDFLILKDIDMSPDSRLNLFMGKNRNGKTSLIKAINAAFRGADASVIRTGTDKAEVIIDLDGLKVHRTITAKTNRLKVTTEAGDIKASPQAYLDQLLSDFSFDPIQFILLDAKERVKYLREMFKAKITPEMLSFLEADTLATLNLDKDGLDVLADAERVYYARRTEINKEVARKKALVEDMRLKLNGFYPEAYQDKREVLNAEIKAVEQVKADAEASKRQAEGTLKLIEKYQAEVAGAEAELNESEDQATDIDKLLSDMSDAIIRQDQLKKELSDAEFKIETLKHSINIKNIIQNNRANSKGVISDRSALIASLPKLSDVPDIAAIEQELSLKREQLAGAETAAAKKADYDRLCFMVKERDAVQQQADVLTEVIDKLRKDLPNELTKQANLPIAGLRFEGGDAVYIGDRNIENLSTSEQVNFAVSIVEKLNEGKPLKLLCLDRAESLDTDSMKAFVAAIPADYQFFLTEVLHEGQLMPEGAYLVENGELYKEVAA